MAIEKFTKNEKLTSDKMNEMVDAVNDNTSSISDIAVTGGASTANAVIFSDGQNAETKVSQIEQKVGELGASINYNSASLNKTFNSGEELDNFIFIKGEKITGTVTRISGSSTVIRILNASGNKIVDLGEGVSGTSFSVNYVIPTNFAKAVSQYGSIETNLHVSGYDNYELHDSILSSKSELEEGIATAKAEAIAEAYPEGVSDNAKLNNILRYLNVSRASFVSEADINAITAVKIYNKHTNTFGKTVCGIEAGVKDILEHLHSMDGTYEVTIPASGYAFINAESYKGCSYTFEIAPNSALTKNIDMGFSKVNSGTSCGSGIGYVNKSRLKIYAKCNNACQYLGFKNSNTADVTITLTVKGYTTVTALYECTGERESGFKQIDDYVSWDIDWNNFDASLDEASTTKIFDAKLRTEVLSKQTECDVVSLQDDVANGELIESTAALGQINSSGIVSSSTTYAYVDNVDAKDGIEIELKKDFVLWQIVLYKYDGTLIGNSQPYTVSKVSIPPFSGYVKFCFTYYIVRTLDTNIAKAVYAIRKPKSIVNDIKNIDKELHGETSLNVSLGYYNESKGVIANYYYTGYPSINRARTEKIYVDEQISVQCNEGYVFKQCLKWDESNAIIGTSSLNSNTAYVGCFKGYVAFTLQKTDGSNITDLSQITVTLSKRGIEDKVDSLVENDNSIDHYHKSALDEYIIKLNKAKQGGQFCFSFITDTHIDTTEVGSRATINGLKACVESVMSGGSNLLIHGGDIADTSEDSTAMTEDDFIKTLMMTTKITDAVSDRRILLRGNHELASLINNSKWYGYTNNSHQRRLLGAVCNNSDLGDYGYIDYADYKIRLIYLDNSLCYYNGESNDAQLAWLETALNMSGKSGWMVIVVGHEPFYDFFWGGMNWIGKPSYRKVLSAFHRGNSVTVNDKTYDFTTQGATPMFMVCGHGHLDTSYINAGNNADFLTIATTDCSTLRDTTHKGNIGSIEECSIDNYIIDPVAKTIKVLRYGYGSDREFTFN